MSASHALGAAWLLLKDFSFLKDHSPEYIKGLRKRMLAHKKNPGPLEHVEMHPHSGAERHYNQRKEERFHSNQKMPKGFEKFAPEHVALFMANDLLSNHPELKDALSQPIPAPNQKKFGDTNPGVMFDMFVTDRKKSPTSPALFSPVMTMGQSGKVGLTSVGAGHGVTSASNRQTIHVVPETGQTKPRVHPRELQDELPARFNFSPADVESSEPDETESAPPTSAAPDPQQLPVPEGMGTPVGFNAPVGFDTMPYHIRDMLIANFLRRQGEGDDVQTGEPMELAWRMLKAVSA